MLCCVFSAVRWDLGALVPVGFVAVAGPRFGLVVLASLLHRGELCPCAFLYNKTHFEGSSFHISI